MTLPLVSILIPSFKPIFFEMALKSAIAQSYENIEIIVSDDCPDDSIHQIAKKYKGITNIIYSRNCKPDGIGHNNMWNCLKMARGEYVKFLFDDDILMPFCVEYMVNAFLTPKDITPKLVVSERWFIDSNNNYIKTNRITSDVFADITEHATDRFMAISLTNQLGEFTTAMWRRQDSFGADGSPLYSSIDGVEITALVDVSMWINLSRLGKVFYIPLPLSCFRIHESANSSAKQKDWYYTLYTDWELIVDRAYANGSITKDESKISYNKLLTLYQRAATTVPSLKGHPERLKEKVLQLDLQQT